ncbi:MAG TPA: hypothetical protein VFT49_03825 [Candidatus Saccharimonadales bacterium]|nr:hypothetical protein [Candidatus Saccharimonadales bacterium]
MMKMSSYRFRMLSLVFWIIVVVGLRQSAVISSLFSHNTSWSSCFWDILALWLFTILACIYISTYGVKGGTGKLFKDLFLSLLQHPFMVIGVVGGLALAMVGLLYSWPILVIIGALINFTSIWVIKWPKKEWYKTNRAKK